MESRTENPDCIVAYVVEKSACGGEERAKIFLLLHTQ
jgi:hypothetical protein